MSFNRIAARLRLPYTQARGFSLIELTIVIVIMAMLMAIAGPEVRGWIQNSRIRTIAENYLAGFQLLRAEAIKSNNSASMELKARGAWDIKNAAGTTTQTRGAGDGDTNVLTTITTPAGATLPYTVTFSGLGRLTTPAASMQIDFTSPATGTCVSAGGSVRCLRINVQVGGAARLCDPARPAGDPQSC